MGAAWGAPIAGVEVRIDDGPWQPATLTAGGRQTFAWSLLDARLGRRPTPASTRSPRGRSATDGEVQPAPDDPFLAGKTTYWESNGQITRQILIP